MDIRVYPTPLKGTLTAPASKSLSHRYVIGAALAMGTSHITNILESDDLHATQDALSALGIKIEGPNIHGGTWRAALAPINCQASGSTLRFMMPIAMRLDETTTFTGTGRLPKRPLDVYETLFASRGQYVRHGTDPLPATVLGPLEPGTFNVSGSVSSQFITGLLFVLPTLPGPSEIILEGRLESAPYVDMTCQVLNAFGITIKKTSTGFKIPGFQVYQPLETTIEGDYSQAAFWLVGGAIGQGLKLGGLNEKSAQGDQAVIPLLKTMGASVMWHQKNLIVQPAPLKPLVADLRDTPDLGPVMMLLAGAVDGLSTFTGLKRLRMKESDRLGVLQTLLKQAGVASKLNNDTLTITGQGVLKGNQRFKTYDDHRIAMALCVLAARFDQPFIVENIEVVRKSYPHFLDDYAALGGRFETL